MSVNPNQSYATPGDSLFHPMTISSTFTVSSITASPVSTITVSVPNVVPASTVLSCVSKDDQQGNGTCWIISGTPGVNNITFSLAAATSSTSQLAISYGVQ